MVKADFLRFVGVGTGFDCDNKGLRNKAFRPWRLEGLFWGLEEIGDGNLGRNYTG